MPEKEVGAEGEAGQDDRAIEAEGCRKRLAAAPRFRCRPRPEQGERRATRQKALAKGPTSAKRTKIGEMPIASAPRRSAATGAARESRGAGTGGRI